MVDNIYSVWQLTNGRSIYDFEGYDWGHRPISPETLLPYYNEPIGLVLDINGPGLCYTYKPNNNYRSTDDEPFGSGNRSSDLGFNNSVFRYLNPNSNTDLGNANRMNGVNNPSFNGMKMLKIGEDIGSGEEENESINLSNEVDYNKGDNKTGSITQDQKDACNIESLEKLFPKSEFSHMHQLLNISKSRIDRVNELVKNVVIKIKGC
ncbi:hypothetical protein AYI69_g8698 [Smittium culicis]|uniref:Uncharacterized protein n=1 Tax=Smittium culicis TaxID=133412 RepID=A0A1R1XHS7_9FUNG|nr:hypothetical protein AYI69_g8698 [Smittium culicis]